VTLDPPDSAFLRTFSFPIHALGPGIGKYVFSIKLYRWLKANYSRFDGVVINGLWTFCGLAALMAISGKKPYMVFSHGMLDPYFKRVFPLKHMKKWVYWVLAEYWVLRGAYRVLFTTREESELARESFWLHRWRGYVVPYGCSRPPENPEGLRELLYTHLPAARGKRFMLYLGRIHRKKGCDLLINSFVRYAHLDPDLHLVMAGPDQQEWIPELQSLVQKAGLNDRVHWPGMLKGDIKWGAFYASEVFILPSHQENFGIAVAEALACGKAALLADKVNIAAQVEKDGAGIMQPDTQEGTDALVKEWIEMPPDRRAAMEHQAVITFTNRYDMQENATTILRLFHRAKQEGFDAGVPASAADSR
jgi:glycosyltransferase involved in cell wall biosynthesis